MPRQKPPTNAHATGQKQGPKTGRGAGGGAPCRPKTLVEQRRIKVQKLMLAGYVGQDLLDELNDSYGKETGVVFYWNTIRKDIAMIRELWKAADDDMRDVLRARHRRELYEMSRLLKQKVLDGEKWAANAWIQLNNLIASVDGTNMPQELKVTHGADGRGKWYENGKATTAEIERFAETGEIPARFIGGHGRNADSGDDHGQAGEEDSPTVH